MAKSGGRAEYEAYLKYLWDRDAQEPARRHRRRRHPLEWDEEFEYPLNELAAANRMLGAMSPLHDPYDAFRARALANVLRQVRTGVASNTRMLDEMGLLRTLDAIHLAAALTLGDELAGIVAYDERLAQAALALGIHVLAPA